ncbi:MAG: (2Fe-2S)-binding protein [Gammaproteobacteria bacterium]|nr:(2Fe-2S)-binding protein [Gammaproteobacteria bacterium]NIN62726.1 (2Fe-2S)-binding protein [Gammaproteobacteria bacterium]NIO63707.1 (2Fe-2S)-binding protein [Gammaproteobacteria bacterium]NIP50085.1 (2Fe-2S)-binding protein [Gammaproteobacteria bacterium]NIQ12303.1 (2Fe-2S)-binding protein [Gammaproteobacteria bacterium]
MIVCLCHAGNEGDIVRAASEGASALTHLSERLNLGTSCGACRDCAVDCLEKLSQSNRAESLLKASTAQI